MRKKHLLQVGLGVLLALLLFALVVTPARAAAIHVHVHKATSGTTSINATIYLSTATLQPIFQSNIDQAVPGAVNSTLSQILNTLPASDRGWASQMASALLQPSAQLTGLAAQQNGLATSLKLSLYPGDPQPINAAMTVTFSVLDSSTIQVSVQPASGNPVLVSGPITTFTLPIGQLNTIATTPTCGNAALAANLQFPLSLGQGQAAGQVQFAHTMQHQLTQSSPRVTAGTSDSYIEIPATSLASLGSSIGTLPISSNMSAQNIQISVQGSNMIINSDVMFGSLQLGTATTTVTPTAVNGSLAINVVSTTLTVFQIFTFPYNTYNQQIEQTLNTQLNGALTGKFTVTNAAIGPDSNLPCAASDSLVLTGTTSLI